MKTTNLQIYPRVSFEGKIQYVYALPTEKGTGTNVSGVMKVKTGKEDKSNVDVPFTIFIGKEKDSKDEKEFEKLFESGFVHNANVLCVGGFFSTTVLKESGICKEKGELTTNDKITGFAIKIDCFDVLDSPDVIKANVELFNAKHKNAMKTNPADKFKDTKIGKYEITCNLENGILDVMNTFTGEYTEDTDIPIDQYYIIIEKYKSIVKEEKQKAKKQK